MLKRFAAALICSALLLPAPALSTILTVEMDGSGDFTSVALAIDASSTGDTILVGPGHYHEPRRMVAHQIVLMSTHGSSVTTLDGDDDHQILRFEGESGYVLDGFQLYRGHNPNNGSGLAVISGATATVRDCEFADNSYAALVASTGASLTVIDCQFERNDTPITGGAMYVSDATAVVMDSWFADNSASADGGALGVANNGDVTVLRCEFDDNSAVLGGGAIFTGFGSTLTVTNSLFTRNVADVGSAIRAYIADITVQSNTFDLNISDVNDGSCVLSRSGTYSFEQNIISNDSGYAAFEIKKGSTGVHQCNLYYGLTGTAMLGGALDPTDAIDDPGYCNVPVGDYRVSATGPASPTGSQCGTLVGAFEAGCDSVPPFAGTVIRVEADGSGDFLTLHEAIDASTGGDTILVGPGHYLEPRRIVRHTLVILSSTGAAATTLDGASSNQILKFDGASSVVLEGFRLTGGYNPSNGTVAFTSGATGVVRNCEFIANTFASLVSASAAIISVDSCLFQDNTSTNDGAGMLVSAGTANISNSVFERCSTTRSGGGISVHTDGIASVVASVFIENNADEWGGGAHCGSDAFLNINNCLFVRNTGDGAGAYYHTGNGSLIGNTFHDNHSSTASVVSYFADLSFQRNIVTMNPLGAGLRLTDAESTPHSCNLFYGNAGGAIDGDALAADDRVEWPGYCDMDNGDYTVGGDGPAAQANSACGQQVGAFGVGCPVSPPAPDLPPPPPDPDAPVILSIEDVPNDQGRMVRIRWSAATEDNPGSYLPVVSYGIYRSSGMIHGSSSPDASAPRSNTAALVDGWDYMKSITARNDGIYQTVVETICDSTDAGLCQTAFFVSAETWYPSVYWDSQPDTGYSVDNLPPEAIVVFRVQPESGSNQLTWSESDAPDIDRYHVYRGVDTSFDPNEEARVAVVDETSWKDPTPGIWVYKVTAVDKAGNESPAVTASSAPQTFVLGQNIPNPFNPATTIPYAVPASGGHVEVQIFDVAGRRIRTLVNRVESPGLKSVTWNGLNDRGQRVSSGIYFYRLIAPGINLTRKMTLLQ